MLKLEVRQLSIVVWSIVSNAALSREREKSGKPIISGLVDRIKEVNERGFSRVMFVISSLWMIETRLADNIGL